MQSGLSVTSQDVWLDCSLIPGEMYRLCATTEGTVATADHAALVRFDMRPDAAGGVGLTPSAAVGPYVYLRSGEGLHRTERLFNVTAEATKLGVRAWADRGPVQVRALSVEKVPDPEGPAAVFLSFDVEALPARAATDPLGTLVWGRIGGGEYGLRRICDVLEQHGATGNFLIDLASCSAWGEAPLRDIADMLAGRGHEIHLHLHPESMPSAQGLEGAEFRLDRASYDMAHRLLDYTVSSYKRATGAAPRLFRSGSYRMNANLVRAAGALGLEALSNVRGPEIMDRPVGGDPQGAPEPFAWENGVLEIPVDASSPEIGTFEGYERRFQAAMASKPRERVFNVVMHSWSLTRRNDAGIHDAYAPGYEEMLHRICEHAVRRGGAIGYGEHIDAWNGAAHPAMPLQRIGS